MLNPLRQINYYSLAGDVLQHILADSRSLSMAGLFFLKGDKMAKTRMVQNFLRQKYMYGGEVWMLGDIIKDLQANAPNQRCVDMYLMGLLRRQKPIVQSRQNLSATFAELNKAANGAWDDIDALEHVKSLRS